MATTTKLAKAIIAIIAIMRKPYRFESLERMIGDFEDDVRRELKV
ncbi:hypothetical protein [Neorhizobium sp. T7_12]|nr:hypothetical protein [Neorhizobium sp. T7_12]